MLRPVIAVTLLFLACAAPARADFSVSAPVLTNDPVVTITAGAGDAVECRLEPADFAPCASPWRPPVGGDGVYQYAVSHPSLGVIGGKFTLDRTAPRLAFTGGPAEGAAQRERQATVEFAGADAHPDTTECRLDGGPYGPCTTAASHTVSGLAGGNHALSVRALDKAGNESVITRRFTVVDAILIVDPTPTPTPTPAPAATSTPRGGVLSASATKPTARLNATRTRRWTRLRTLQILDVPAGTAIEVTCKGTGCPPRALRLTATKTAGAVSVKGLTGRRLRPGAVVVIRLSRPGAADQSIRIAIRSRRAPLVS